MRAWACVPALLLVAACGGAPSVARVYDGRVVNGHYVAPEAYAAFLRGVLAEESGDLAGAAKAYEAALTMDAKDPLVLARLGAVRCRMDPKATGLPADLRRAALADEYAPANLEASRCASLRGSPRVAAEEADEALREDPLNPETSARRTRTEPQGAQGARTRALAATLLFADRAVAWDALRWWGDAHGDPVLVAHGLRGLLRTAPQRSAEVESGAIALAVAGHVTAATEVAVAVAEAPPALEIRGPKNGFVARLAVDEALARRDEDASRRRANRGRVPLVEVAARAAALGALDASRSIARGVLAADPGASGARMVLAALGDVDVLDQRRAATDVPPEVAMLVFAQTLASRSRLEAARAFVASLHFTEAPVGDPVVRDLRRALVERRVLPPPASVDAR